MLIIDRIEGDIALCEDAQETMHEIPRSLLPAGAREGDVIRVMPGGGYALDPDEMQKRKARVASLMQRLFTKRTP